VNSKRFCLLLVLIPSTRVTGAPDLAEVTVDFRQYTRIITCSTLNVLDAVKQKLVSCLMAATSVPDQGELNYELLGLRVLLPIEIKIEALKSDIGSDLFSGLALTFFANCAAFEDFKAEWKQQHASEDYAQSVAAIKCLINVIELSAGENCPE